MISSSDIEFFTFFCGLQNSELDRLSDLVETFPYYNTHKLNVIDKYGYNGDLIEAQMFGYLAVRSLKKMRLPVMKWPDLPPEVLADPENHRFAHNLEKNLLFFPVHQSLNISAIKKHISFSSSIINILCILNLKINS